MFVKILRGYHRSNLCFNGVSTDRNIIEDDGHVINMRQYSIKERKMENKSALGDYDPQIQRNDKKAIEAPGSSQVQLSAQIAFDQQSLTNKIDQHRDSGWEVYEEKEPDDLEVVVRDRSQGVGQLMQKLISQTIGGQLGTHKSNNQNKEAKAAFNTRVLINHPMMLCENSRELQVDDKYNRSEVSLHRLAESQEERIRTGYEEIPRNVIQTLRDYYSPRCVKYFLMGNMCSINSKIDIYDRIIEKKPPRFVEMF